MRSDSTIRPATPCDIVRAVETLGHAFVDYPFFRHTVDVRDHRNRVHSLHSLYLTEVGMRCGKVWVSDDVSAVAVWATPAANGLDLVLEAVAGKAAELHGDRAEIDARADEATVVLHPSDPVWYLASVGVDPASQGRGLGRAVLQPGIEAAEAQSCPAYLETCKPANVEFYQHLGSRSPGP
ncbi:GNAT family N-acetyltransferase [Rhodococcus spongiicola]|uniref:GNAT family N-acetyltransferase n=1 Tax=Rhodococcus spongiicola TaxID=2487352 RepID=UPI002E25322B